MDEPDVPFSASTLSRLFWRLHQERKQRHHENRGARREHLTAEERTQILDSTGKRCHICGGKIRGRWQADHVLAHSNRGEHAMQNYLPAHRLCNNYRWDYSAEEFQWILKLGVWVKTQIERDTDLGLELRDAFHRYERARQNRRQKSASSECDRERCNGR